MKIAILGFGSVGQKLNQIFQQAGYQVVVGVRQPEAGTEQLSFAQAATDAEAIVLAIPFQACQQLLSELQSILTGKIIIDATNPLNDDWSPLLLGQENSAAEEIAKLLPGSNVVKAFNTIFVDVMDKPVRNSQKITAFIAGDDEAAKGKVMLLAEKSGYTPLDSGPLFSARYLENMAHLNIQIAVGQGGGTDAAFIYSN